MYKLTLAFMTLALAAGIASARADSSGRPPRSNDPMAPMSDRSFAPNYAFGDYGRSLRADAPESRAAASVPNGSACQGHMAYPWSWDKSC
jgi:hypothetical protein